MILLRSSSFFHFLEKFWFLRVRLCSSQPFSMQKSLLPLPPPLHLVFHVTFPPAGVSLMLWLSLQSPQNWFMVYRGTWGDWGWSQADTALVQSAVLRDSSSYLWGGSTLAWPTSANGEAEAEASSGPLGISVHIWAQIFPTSHAHPRLLCPPWPASQPFL